ncbi:hypothetical protein SMACR_12099 [Sordaria macrospora]|uniref:WGS project CABT00000000 data, contig 2.5 n=2 Tax=Sordaria macrospora TaxID=5147 RepID=F7VS82_SORMK|nr:uncharacterized protein SMAC_12099 [Sordaria macrospora k-hell]KAA8634005.1 hypothetical protein SMACR_12099 [Sordaria macrospora]CCC08368.1 unnamed protein product [Sordaria macrospora k-hell]
MAPANPPTMAAPQVQKTMSSRLMTMKFMQRAAATAATAATASPTDKSSISKTEDEGPSKRRKHSHASKTSTPNAEAEQALYDQKAIQAALEEEEKKRQAAIEKRAAELGDSHWVLPGAAVAPKAGARPVLNVVQVGFAQIDYSGNANDDDDAPAVVSTTPRFRQFNIKKKKACLFIGQQVCFHTLTWLCRMRRKKTMTRVIRTVIAQAQTPTMTTTTTIAPRMKHPQTPTSRRIEANNRVLTPGDRNGQGQGPRSLTERARSAGRQRSLRKAEGRGKLIPTALPRYLRVASPKALSGRVSPGPATLVDKTVTELPTAPASRGSSVMVQYPLQLRPGVRLYKSGRDAHKLHDHGLLLSGPERGQMIGWVPWGLWRTGKCVPMASTPT